MSYLTFDDLSTKYRSTEYFSKAENLNESLSGEQISYDKRIFLSYRRKDKKYVDPIVRFLKGIGVKVYIDYLDDSLPDKPDTKTAEILRHRIKNSDKFILLATPNSSESKWIPWELGLGDGFINYNNVAILPLLSSSSYWSEQEYYSIYGHIEKANSRDKSKYDWAIFYPNGQAEWLINWLKK